MGASALKISCPQNVDKIKNGNRLPWFKKLRNSIQTRLLQKFREMICDFRHCEVCVAFNTAV